MQIPAQVRALFVRLQGGAHHGGVQRGRGHLRRAGRRRADVPQSPVRQDTRGLLRAMAAVGRGGRGSGASVHQPQRPRGVQRVGRLAFFGRQLCAQRALEAQGRACGERRRDAGRGGAQGRGALQDQGHRGVDKGVPGQARRRTHRRTGDRNHAAARRPEPRQGDHGPETAKTYIIRWKLKRGRASGRTRIAAHTVCKQKINRKMCKTYLKR